jgi:hypothetical protein
MQEQKRRARRRGSCSRLPRELPAESHPRQRPSLSQAELLPSCGAKSRPDARRPSTIFAPRRTIIGFSVVAGLGVGVVSFQVF